MSRSSANAFLAQILPLLTNRNAFENFINQAPLSKEEKNTITQIYNQISNPQSTGDSLPALNGIIQNLMSRSNPEQLKNLAPLTEQISKMSPENLRALQKMLGL